MLNDKVAEFYKLSSKIGGEVEEQVIVFVCVCVWLCISVINLKREEIKIRAD